MNETKRRHIILNKTKRRYINFKCPVCGLTFDNYREVLEHYTRMHSFITFKMKKKPT